MAAPQHTNDLQRDYEIGGGKKQRVKVVTDGHRVAEFEIGEPVLLMPPVGAAPAVETQKGKLFFMDDGAGKMQLCVRFPSGATQILATEP